MKLLALAALPLVNALSLYEYQCPHPSQWNLRSRILCEGEQNRISYSCLYDEHNNTYIESCSENADFVRPGQRYVRFFQRSNVDCMKTRYQPIKFRSNLNSQCIFLKSFCNELGQKLFSVGSTREDTKCYCDYEKGFLYITKPSHPCFCVPAEEDCSCYNECTGRKKSYECLFDEQVETISKCFQSLNDTMNTVPIGIQPQTDSTELGNDEVNDGYKLLQRKDLFYEMLVVLSICVALLAPTILVFKMFTCKDFSEQQKKDNHKPIDQCIIQIDRNEDIKANEQAALCHLQAANRDISELHEHHNNRIFDQYHDEINRTDEIQANELHEIQANELHEIRQKSENRDLCECVRNGSRTSHTSHDKYLIDTGWNEEISSIIIHELLQSQPEKKVKSTSQLRKNYRHFEDRNLSLEREKSWNEINIEKQSPLLQASIRGNLDTLKVLFQNGCNLNVKNESGFTPLMMASLNGHTDVVNHLIHIDVDLNSRDNFGKTAVFYATEESHFEVIRMLITKKCDINIANNSGETPFVHSIKKECFEVADLLISGGANIHEVNANDETALWIACHEGKVAAVEYLIGLGFDVNKTNKNKQTSLWLACNNGLLEIVKILIKYKGDVNKADMRSWTPLKAAASRGCADICEYLLSHRADVNKADEEGWTPLMSACREGHQFCVEILIKNKADCQLWNHQEKTALWLASQYGKESIVRLLLSKSDINKCDHKNRTPLDAASSSGHIGVCNLLRSVNHKS